MKWFQIITVLLISACFAQGQTPSSSPTKEQMIAAFRFAAAARQEAERIREKQAQDALAAATADVHILTGVVKSVRSEGILLKEEDYEMILLRGYPKVNSVADRDHLSVVAVEDGIFQTNPSHRIHAFKFLDYPPPAGPAVTPKQVHYDPMTHRESPVGGDDQASKLNHTALH